MKAISYKRHRFPPEVIQHAVWLYFRFTLSLRDVEDLLAERGIEVSYETVRCWSRKFGLAIARNLRRLQGKADTVWHADEMVVKIGGKRMYMWRAVDKEGVVLDAIVQKRRNKAAAMKLLRKLLKRQGFVPEQSPPRPKAREKDAKIQISGPSPAIRLHPQRRLQHIQHRTPSHFQKHHALSP